MARQDRLDAVLARHGTSFAEEVGVDLRDPRPADLWSWYLACLLMSARISTDLAVRATRAYLDQIGRSVRATAEATWKQRVDVLNANGYARYDERTSAMLGDTADAIEERYGGDLRRLREEADGDPDRVHRLLQQFKGVGRVGADIYCREVQVAWDELYPFVDPVAADVAASLGLGRTPKAVAGLVARTDLPRLLAALVRAKRAKDLDAVRDGQPPSPGGPRTVLARLSRRELGDLAKQADVRGRSSMTRDDLLDALAG